MSREGNIRIVDTILAEGEILEYLTLYEQRGEIQGWATIDGGLRLSLS